MDKQSFSEKYVKHNTAVLCKTDEESNEFLKHAYEFGFISEEQSSRNDWFEDGLAAYCVDEECQSDTDSSFSFDHPESYKKFGYEIIEFSDRPTDKQFMNIGIALYTLFKNGNISELEMRPYGYIESVEELLEYFNRLLVK